MNPARLWSARLIPSIRLATLAIACAAPPTAADPPSQSPRLGIAEAPASAPGTLRLATYNVLNLFDDHDDPALTDRHDDMFSSRNNQRAKPEAQRKALADAIKRTNADIIGLQEVESFDALNAFRKEYLDGLGYEHIVSIDVGQERGIEQAVISRFPITEATVWPTLALGGIHPEKYGTQRNWHAGESIMYRRSPLRVRIEVPAKATGDEPYELTLFVIHHKSGRYSEYWREAEAKKLCEMLEAIRTEDPSRNIAVLGDFNALPTDTSARAYERIGYRHVIQRDGSPDPQRLTHESDRPIDFILVNDALAAEIVEGSAFVLGTPVRAKGANYRTVPPPANYASDHLPVCVDIVPREQLAAD